MPPRTEWHEPLVHRLIETHGGQPPESIMEAYADELRAAAKHGFRYAITPKPNVPKEAIPGLEILPVSRLSEALALLSR